MAGFEKTGGDGSAEFLQEVRKRRITAKTPGQTSGRPAGNFGTRDEDASEDWQAIKEERKKMQSLSSREAARVIPSQSEQKSATPVELPEKVQGPSKEQEKNDGPVQPDLFPDEERRSKQG